MARKRSSTQAPFSHEQIVTYGLALQRIDRRARTEDITKGVTLTSFTSRLDGEEWFLILHGVSDGYFFVMYGRCSNLLQAGAVIEGLLTTGKWLPDRYKTGVTRA
jgi:hypothetical protein